MAQQMKIGYGIVQEPEMHMLDKPRDLPQSVCDAHMQLFCEVLKSQKLDVALIYADREHGSNFGYLTQFEPRFEEACLIVHQSGEAYALLGNECLKMGQYSRIPVTALHVPAFSLPNQPMQGLCLRDALSSAKVGQGMHVGVIGWKLFTGDSANRHVFDIPHYIIEALVKTVGDMALIENRTDIMIHPAYGLRTVVGADEAAQFEYQATLASQCVYRVITDLKTGVSECELANHLAVGGQPLSCYSMCATGARFTNAVVFPREKKVCMGDPFTTSMGLRGGLTCRSGYVAATPEDLDRNVRDYIDQVAKPYFAASVAWYETLHIGLTGGELYQTVEDVIPKSKFHWTLNPGHLTSAEEWLSSPIFEGSEIKLRSGMMFQMDIIAKVEGYAGVNAEDGAMLADCELRAEIREKYPQVWSRMQARRDYMQRVLGIKLHPEVLPMSDTVGYVCPLLLNHTYALYKEG